MNLPAREPECDVLVIGSGVAGLAAAITAAQQGLRVTVAEQSHSFGGTTAISAGWAWVPGNKQGQEQGDTRSAVETYLRALSPTSYNEAGVTRFLDAVPEALRFFEEHTELQFVYPEQAPDYQMDLPGARLSGRAITPREVDARILGDKRLLVQPYMSSYTVFGYMPQVGPDITQFFQVNQSLRSFTYVAKKLLRTWLDTALYRRSVQRSNGNAMIIRMLKTAQDLGVQLWNHSPVVAIHRNADGVLDSATLGGPHAGRIRASHGVILAAGGFTGNSALRQEFFPHDPAGDNHFSPTVGHSGDAVTLARSVGGVVDDAVSSPGSWAPVTVFRDRAGRQRLFPHLRAIGLPGLIAVDRTGRRFGNEALSYHDFGRQMLSHESGQDQTYAWVLADAKTMHKYGIGYAKPWPMPRGYFYRIGYLVKGRSLEELAEKIGLEPDTIAQTVAEFNSGAELGEDPAFGRGSTRYNHFRGDMTHKPNPNLATLDPGATYAAKIQMGDLGSFAGLAVNERSEVVTKSGAAIPGLYAVGAAAVSVFGGGYPGYGSHIGPALIFGYLAGRDIAAHHAARTGENPTAGATPPA